MATRSTSKQAKAESAALVGKDGPPPLLNRVKPVSNALTILRYLSRIQQPATLTHVAKELKLNPSTCFNILRTLVWEGVVHFDEPSKAYTVGLGLAHLTERSLTESERIGLLKPKLHQVAEMYGVTVLLLRRVGNDRMILVAMENSLADLQIHLRMGVKLPLLAGATGRVVASQLGLTKQELREQFRAVRWARRLSFDEFWQDVELAAKRGWAVDDGYFSTGAMTVAVPVFDRGGVVTHSLVAIMFRGQHDVPTVRKIAQDLTELGKQLGSALG